MHQITGGKGLLGLNETEELVFFVAEQTTPEVGLCKDVGAIPIEHMHSKASKLKFWFILTVQLSNGAVTPAKVQWKVFAFAGGVGPHA